MLKSWYELYFFCHLTTLLQFDYIIIVYTFGLSLSSYGQATFVLSIINCYHLKRQLNVII